HARVIRLAGCFSLQTLTPPMAAALLFWQITDLLRFSNLNVRRFMIGARQTDDDFGHSAIVRVMLRLRLNKSLARLSKLRHFYEFEKPNTSDVACSATTCPLKSTHDRTL